MDIDRRKFNHGILAATVMLLAEDADAAPTKGKFMYGLISQLITKREQRDELVTILATATKGMPGCLSYVIALDALRDDAVWITEVWTDSESHAASLSLPQVQVAMTKGRPLITEMASRTETHPISGV